MSELKKRLNVILTDLEKNIEDKEELEYVKSQIYNISMLFLDEIDKIATISTGRLNAVMDREKELNKRIALMEKTIRNIEKEMYITDECDFSIQCPYCNAEFVADFTDGYKHEVRCPECDNEIQLEWGQDDDCHCDSCNHEHECDGSCDGECDDDCCGDCDCDEYDDEDDM